MGKKTPVLAALAMLLALARSAFASGGITDLGRPTNDIPPYHPLGAFRHVGTSVSQHGKPELLFIGTQVEGNSAAETWAVVKALDQFGTFSNVQSTITRPCMFDRYNRLNCTLTPPAQPPPGYHFPAGYHFQAGYSTFDWDRARYSSPYLVFVHRDLIDRNLHMLQGLPSGELALFNRYVRRSGYPGWKDAVWRTAIDSSLQEPEHRFPLVGVGNYLETGSNVAIYGDLIGYLGAYGMLLPFSTVQESLQRGGPVGHAPSSLIFDFNAETNVTTALICHADHLQPRTVCSRKPIQSILKHVR